MRKTIFGLCILAGINLGFYSGMKFKDHFAEQEAVETDRLIQSYSTVLGRCRDVIGENNHLMKSTIDLISFYDQHFDFRTAPLQVLQELEDRLNDLKLSTTAVGQRARGLMETIDSIPLGTYSPK